MFVCAKCRPCLDGVLVSCEMVEYPGLALVSTVAGKTRADSEMGDHFGAAMTKLYNWGLESGEAFVLGALKGEGGELVKPWLFKQHRIHNLLFLGFLFGCVWFLFLER